MVTQGHDVIFDWGDAHCMLMMFLISSLYLVSKHLALEEPPLRSILPPTMTVLLQAAHIPDTTGAHLHPSVTLHVFFIIESALQMLCCHLYLLLLS